MKITRQSQLTGVTHTKDIPITKEQLHELSSSYRTRLVQAICPDLSPSDREFLMTGITDEEWESLGWHDEEDA